MKVASRALTNSLETRLKEGCTACHLTHITSQTMTLIIKMMIRSPLLSQLVKTSWGVAVVALQEGRLEPPLPEQTMAVIIYVEWLKETGMRSRRSLH